jgi:hypothetical protein
MGLKQVLEVKINAAREHNPHAFSIEQLGDLLREELLHLDDLAGPHTPFIHLQHEDVLSETKSG